MKHMLTPGMIFQELGFRYVGPVDGHDLDVLVETLGRVRDLEGPLLLHVITRKGKGFHLAEEDPWTWHAASPFDKITGRGKKKLSATPSPLRYQKVFGTGLTELAAEYSMIVAITAAMPDGTSTNIFWDVHPDRFFDVGIAEQHAVTAAAGMAMGGLRPVVAIYSTFLTRAIDQTNLDVSLHRLPVLFCVDRAGITGDDGPSHHGLLDMVLLSKVPGMTIFAPSSYQELQQMLEDALALTEAPAAIRSPKTNPPHLTTDQDGPRLAAPHHSPPTPPIPTHAERMTDKNASQPAFPVRAFK